MRKPLTPAQLEHLQRIVDEPELDPRHYRVLERLGAGGMGTVFLCDDLLLERRVAVKVVQGDGAPELERRLEREARLLARLEHPSFVPVHDRGTLPDGRAWYAMRYVDGPTLERWLESSPPLGERLRLFARLCEALAFAHERGIVHRDLKPANVMVGPFGELLVLDWGLATVLGEPATERPGAILGTPGFMAPEQARGENEAIDARVDVYALGALLRCLLEAPPRESVRLRALYSIAARALEPDPARRYASALELGRDVLRFLDGEAVLAHRETAFERVRRIYARHRFVVLLVASYLVLRVLIAWFASPAG